MNSTEKADIDRRVKTYRKLNTTRYYMVTFDLKGSKGREALYAKFRSHLTAFVGEKNTHRFIKQCYFIRSNFAQKDIRKEMQTFLSRHDSILVTRLGAGASFSFPSSGAAPAARKFFADIEDVEIED